VPAIIGRCPFLRIDRRSHPVAVGPASQHDPIGDGADEPRRRMRAP
jgi:hypothetical protein